MYVFSPLMVGLLVESVTCDDRPEHLASLACDNTQTRILGALALDQTAGLYRMGYSL